MQDAACLSIWDEPMVYDIPHRYSSLNRMHRAQSAIEVFAHESLAEQW